MVPAFVVSGSATPDCWLVPPSLVCNVMLALLAPRAPPPSASYLTTCVVLPLVAELLGPVVDLPMAT